MIEIEKKFIHYFCLVLDLLFYILFYTLKRKRIIISKNVDTLLVLLTVFQYSGIGLRDTLQCELWNKMTILHNIITS